ncbi:MAG: hypothetical protein QXN87_06805 [Candidatus Bathyarchaeia archaeon]
MKRKLNLLAGSSIFLYSLSLLLTSVFQLEIPLIFPLILILFIPGYTIVEAFSLVKTPIEKLSVSIGLSLAILLGTRGMLQITMMRPYLSEIVIVSFITSLLSIKLIVGKE